VRNDEAEMSSLQTFHVARPDGKGTELLERETLALVLAGGNGTRLGALTRSECKPALPFAGKYRTIDFSLSNCVHSGIRRIAVLTQYEAQTLLGHIEQAWSFLPRQLGEFVDPWPAQQRSGTQRYGGTADALHRNLDLIRSLGPRLVLVLAGDHVYRMDYRAMLERHVNTSADVTVACVPVPRVEAPAFGIPTVSPGGRIRHFVEKPPLEHLPADAARVRASMGVYVFSLDYLCDRLAQDALDVNSAHDIGRNILPRAVNLDRVYAHDFVDPVTGAAEFWRDVGTLDSYWQAHMEVLEPSIAGRLFDARRPIFTHRRNLAPPVLPAGATGMVAGALVSDGCTIADARIRHSVLGHEVRVGAGSHIEHCVVLPGTTIGRNCRLQRAIIDRGCHVPDGTIVGRDATRDGERFHVSEGGIVLVTSEALAQSVAERDYPPAAFYPLVAVHAHERSARAGL
jgi:glucose-1-phosphate adenylyltransferase